MEHRIIIGLPELSPSNVTDIKVTEANNQTVLELKSTTPQDLPKALENIWYVVYRLREDGTTTPIANGSGLFNLNKAVRRYFTSGQ